MHGATRLQDPGAEIARQPTQCGKHRKGHVPDHDSSQQRSMSMCNAPLPLLRKPQKEGEKKEARERRRKEGSKKRVKR
jgi:hypothetical protein